MKYSRKSQIQSKVFIYILVGVVILLLLIFAFLSIKKARDRAREIEQKKLEQEIDTSLKEIEYGSVERKKLNVPEGTKELCFIDITKITEVLTSPILRADKYKRMKNIIQSGDKKNIFFLTQQEPYITSIYQKGICFDHYPYFACFEPRANILNLYIEGKGSCALIILEYRVCQDMTGKYDTDGKTTIKEINFGSIFTKLTIPSRTTITEPDPAPNEICIEAVSYIGAEGLISEVYNVTPSHITTSQNVVFDLKYEEYLLPPNADAGRYVKLKKSSSPWELLSDLIIDPGYGRVSGKTNELSYVAVFGPELPIANISVDGGVNDIPEGAEIIVAKDDVVNFDGSLSSDPDDDIVSYDWVFGDAQTGTGKTTTHTYLELGSYNVSLTVTDQLGYTDTRKIIVTVVNNNNVHALPDNTIIMISNPTANWKNILSLVPLAMWKDINGNHINPYVVYHKEGIVNWDDFVIQNLRYNYFSAGPTVEIFLYTSESVLIGGSIPGISIVGKSFDETGYFNYWSSYQDIVVVDYNNEDDALMASLFAAFINAPIIFINSANLPDISVIQGKTAYVVNYNAMDTDSKNYIDNNANIRIDYSSLDIRNPTKNQYQYLRSKIPLTSIY